MPLHAYILLTVVIGNLLTPSYAEADASLQVTATPSVYGGGRYTGIIGAVTPTPLSVSLYTSTFGSNYWPYVATDASGQNTLIPTSSMTDANFVTQTTNAGNPVNGGNQPSSTSQSAASAASSLHSSQSTSAPSTTLAIQTGNAAAGTMGLGRPAAVVVGAALIIGGAMI